MKKIFSILFFLVFAFSSSVSAHTGLKAASPSEGETITEDLQEITLTFETPIETGSTFSLLQDDGKEIILENLRIEKNQLIGTLKKPLENGNHTVKWSIVGEDGHLIKGEYLFTIAKNLNKEKGDSEPTSKPAEETKRAHNIIKAGEEDEKNPKKNNIVIPILTGFLLFVALQTTVWLIRRGRKK